MTRLARIIVYRTKLVPFVSVNAGAPLQVIEVLSIDYHATLHHLTNQEQSKKTSK